MIYLFFQQKGEEELLAKISILQAKLCCSNVSWDLS